MDISLFPLNIQIGGLFALNGEKDKRKHIKGQRLMTREDLVGQRGAE